VRNDSAFLFTVVGEWRQQDKPEVVDQQEDRQALMCNDGSFLSEHNAT
jgi:hypothetical protein